MIDKSAETPPGSISWLITGGCGFIGINLIRQLLAEGGHFIRVLDNLSVGTKADLEKLCAFREFDSANWPEGGSKLTDHEPVQFIRGDIQDDEICLKATRGIDVIVHLAANTGVGPSVEAPRADMENNIIGIFNVLEAARQNRVRRFIFASSGAPIGECTPPIHEELAPHPVSPYGASKLAGEGYCSAYYRTFGVETVALRFGNVYGPGSGHKNSVIAKFIKQALAGDTVEIYGDGTQTRDFIYTEDLIQAIRLAQSTPDIGGEIFQIASSQEHTVNEVAELLQSELKKECGREMIVTYGQPRLGDVKRNFSDTSKAENLLGWKSKLDLEAGIQRVVKWFSAEQAS